MKNDYVNIVLNFDRNYLIPAAVTMFSITRNLSKNRVARFFLLVSDWDEECKNKIFKLKDCEINIIEMEKYLHYFKNIDRNSFKIEYLKSSFSSCYRLFIPKLLPEYVEKVIYVDSDVIVDMNLSEIYDKMESDKLLYAVTEYVTVSNGDLFEYFSEWDEFSKFNKNSEKYPYFNSGFFLMNLNLARKLNIFDDFIKFLEKHPQCHYCDQDTLNAVCGQKYSDKMVYLAPEYNVSCDIENYNNIAMYFKTGYTYGQLKKAFSNPKIYHFASIHKPWLGANTKHYGEVWHSYFENSPFYDSYNRTRTNNNEKLNEKENKEIKENNISYSKSNLIRKKEWIYLFNFIPFLKIKKNILKSHLRVYLFGFIPIFKVKGYKIKIYFFGIQCLRLNFNTFRLQN